MLATVSLLIGILLGAVVLSFARRPFALRAHSETEHGAAGLPASNVTMPGWLTLLFGLVALAALVLGTGLGSGPGNRALGWLNLSIALAFAALVAGIGMLGRGERGWPTWVGLIAGLIPAIFWIWFALGNLLGSG